MKSQDSKCSKRVSITNDYQVRPLLMSIISKESYEAVVVDEGREAYRFCNPMPSELELNRVVDTVLVMRQRRSQ